MVKPLIRVGILNMQLIQGSGLKGVKPPVEFGKRIRDSSPGHAGTSLVVNANTSNGQATTHKLQPLQRSVSTTTAPLIFAIALFIIGYTYLYYRNSGCPSSSDVPVRQDFPDSVPLLPNSC